MIRRLLLLILVLLTSSVATARGIDAQLVAEGPGKAGGEVDLAIQMQPQPGWHGYWLNPGDAGLPMDVHWHLPQGFTVGPLRYPVPSRLEIANLMNFVFKKDFAVLVRLRVPPNAKGVVPIRADAHWLACTDKICVPEQGELSLMLPIGSGTPNRSQFDRWRRHLPRPLASLAHFQVAGDKIRIAIPLPSSVTLDHPYIFPVTDGPVDYDAKEIFHRSNDVLIAELGRKGAVANALSGVLSLDAGEGLQFRAVPGPVPEGFDFSSLGWKAIFLAIFGAILGGALLNLMPCVFPILALKALHLSRAGGDAKHARTDAISYTFGAVIGTALLGLALLLLRAAGAVEGWAFQLQDPRAIFILLLLALAITANLLGFFDLPVVGGNVRPAGSFGTGALAAFVATPCAGPFLGAALGTALLLPAFGSIVVFASLGFGLGLPFLIIAFVPALRTRLPKPGAWMRRLQQALAIPMAASALACLWLLNRQDGARGLAVGALLGLLVIVTLSIAGRLQRNGIRGGWAAFSAIIVVAVLGVVALPLHANVQVRVQGATPFSEARLSAYLGQRQPVFVYFTADWCLSCKVNEVSTIDRQEVQDALHRAHVKILAGDWTNGDPEITRFLESHGRAGVPLYLWYAPQKSPEQLPQILTPTMLISRARLLPQN